ncbi:IS1634 family transposase [Cupriavidus sp. IDO]|uniref:IS1634 family transposase n=1 Tax=Cupriavidus sp. IDO TaxID=1539142 RepID=UPI00057945DA|nr:IS1634 family transposase [Cupriavidus sp. IDO]KWR84604.1 tail length tape measure protein [Cupriavidus sp. IDO]
MYIETVPNRNSPPAILLREGYREGGKVVKRTLANLSHWDPQLIEHFRILLKGGIAVESAQAPMSIERSLPHGHVAAVLGIARRCGLAKLLDPAPAPVRSLVLALVVARVLAPGSKLATWRMLQPQCATHSLSQVLGLGAFEVERLYAALDWLGEAQPRIESSLARQHLSDGVLVLYDLTSTWVTGRHCALARYGYSRDGKRDDPQIVFGLLCAADGCPVAVEVFAGNTADPATLAAQISKLKQRFGLSQVVWVGDRGMITAARIEQVLRPAGMSWITALRSPQIAELIEERGPWQPSLFEERGLIALDSTRYPGERLLVCRNPALAEERARKRAELLAATEVELAAIAQATERARNRLRGQDKIGLRVGRVIERYRMAKHFELDITETSFTFTRKQEQIDAEIALDGLYVLRTNVPSERLSDTQTVLAYKSLAQVERAFRSMKTVDLQVRPIYHFSESRVRAHVFLCMLAYYVEWHLRQALKPLLHDDEDLATLRDQRANPVMPTPRSEGADAKAARHRTDDDLPAHSLQTLLQDLATLTYNITSTSVNPQTKIVITTRPTPLQRKAFALLGIDPGCSQ